MSNKVEKLIEAIGDTKDKNVLLAVGNEKTDAESGTDVHSVEFREVPSPDAADIRRYKLRRGILGGLAAALVITGSIVLWNVLKSAPPVETKPSSTTENSVNEPVVTVPDFDPDMRDLKWGMTVGEVKAHEPEAPLREEYVSNYFTEGRAQTVLDYGTVKYRDHDAGMLLYVDKADGLFEVYYQIDAARYPDAWNELKAALDAEYGAGSCLADDLCKWDIKQRDVQIVLTGHDNVVQVYFYQYVYQYGISPEPPEDTQKESNDLSFGKMMTYPVRDDQIHPIFDKESKKIFTDVFYGEWKSEKENADRSELKLTFSEDWFDYGHSCYPCNIIETDDLYGLTYVIGGELSCHAVLKDRPDVIYNCAYNYYSGDEADSHNAVYLYPQSPIYTGRTINEMPDLRSGKLSNLGEKLLMYYMGEDFAEFYRETLLRDSSYNGDGYDGTGYIDENGTSWLIVSSMGYPRDTRCLVSTTYFEPFADDSVITVGIPYYEKNEYEAHDYLGDDEEVPWKKYFALEFAKTGEKWQVTHRPLEEVYEEFDTLTFEAPEAKNRMLASVVCNDVKKVYGKYSFPEAKVIVTDTKTRELLGFTEYSTPARGSEGYSSKGDIEVRIYSVRPDRALVVCFVPGYKSIVNQKMIYHASFYWCDRGTVKYLNMEAPDPGIEINSLDDISLSGNEVICVTDSDGNEMRFVVDQNGHTVLKCDEMGDTEADKARAYKFPIWKYDDAKLISGEILPAEELAMFQSYNPAEAQYDTYGAGKFLDSLGVPDLKKMYYSGRFLMGMVHPSGMHLAEGFKGYSTDPENRAVIEIGGYKYYSTGFNCDSFLAAFSEIFTDEWEPVMLSLFENSGFIEYGEELYAGDSAGGGNPALVFTEYELVKQTDDEIIFNAIAYDAADPDTEGPYDPAKKDRYLKEYQVFRFVKTAGGWRIAHTPTDWEWY